MIGVLLITHGRLGVHFVETLTGMLGHLPLPTEVLESCRGDDPDTLIEHAVESMAHLDRGDGVLLITDAYGSTPSNIANQARKRNSGIRSRVISGINLPMLIRLYNYPGLGLNDAADSAIEAGRDGIISNDDKPT